MNTIKRLRAPALAVAAAFALSACADTLDKVIEATTSNPALAAAASCLAAYDTAAADADNGVAHPDWQTAVRDLCIARVLDAAVELTPSLADARLKVEAALAADMTQRFLACNATGDSDRACARKAIRSGAAHFLTTITTK